MAIRPVRRGAAVHRGLADTLTWSARCLRLARRNPDQLVMALSLPVMLMLMFVYLFGGAIHTGGHYVTYVVPGVLLLCTGFGASQTAVTVSADLHGPTLDRLRSLDVSGAAVLGGHVVASVVRNAVSTLVVIGVAVAIGFRPDAGLLDWICAVGLLLGYVVALSWVGALIGVVAKTPESASGFSFFVMFLPYASSAFVPIATMPSWIRPIARNQPVTVTVEAVRALLVSGTGGSSAGAAIAWMIGLIVISVGVTVPLFRRRAV